MTEKQTAGKGELQRGRECFLNVTGRHFHVTILEVGADTVRVSFSGKDYPIEGMEAILEFHDDSGFTAYSTRVIEGPGQKGEGLRLKCLADGKRNVHRDCFRAPTDLTVQVKEQVHVRKFDAALVNLSAGGALLQTEAEFDFSTVVEITMSLPGEPSCVVLGQVVHVAEAPKRYNAPSHFYGIRFLNLEPEVQDGINRYIWNRLRELFPAE